MIDCGPHGVLNCGHAHADALSFVLASKGQTFLIDPGTYTYSFPRTLRDELRHSRSHNTATVDRESSSVPSGPFQWKQIARSTLERWISRDGFDYFAGSHDGYQRLPDPVGHRRAVLFLKSGLWVIHDRFSAVEEHEVELSFQFAPDVEVCTEGNLASAVARGEGGVRPTLHLRAFGEQIELRCEKGSISRSFGELAEGSRCVIATRGRGVQQLVVLVAPGPPLHAEAVPTSGGLGIRVEGEDCTDLLLIGDGGPVRAAGVESDFAWTLVRTSKEGGRIREMTLLEGRRLALEGRDVVASDAEVSYLAAGVSTGEISVDSDQPDALLLGPEGAPLVPFEGSILHSPGSGRRA
jgi:hypothetical protein